MLKYPCLVLDHDDTVVASEASVNYPCFLMMLEHFRPGQTMDLNTFTRWCFDPGFSELLRQKYQFSEQEISDEFQMWVEYSKDHIPPAFPGIGAVIRRQKAEGGLICVVSHSSRSNIIRDYRTHFDTEPDMVFSWEDPEPQRKPAPYPLRSIMEQYKLEPSQLLVVDDLKPGFDMAKACNVQVAYAGWGRKNVPEITQKMIHWCDYAFDAPHELEHFLFDA